MGNGENLMELKVYDQIDELVLENKRLKKLVDDLQREYMNRISELAEIHPLEEK
jgi:hypothetical protein